MTRVRVAARTHPMGRQQLVLEVLHPESTITASLESGNDFSRIAESLRIEHVPHREHALHVVL